MFLSALSYRTNLKLHNSSVTLKLFQKVATGLDCLTVSSTDCITVLILKNFEPELSHILAELFNMYLNESCFPDFLKVSYVSSLFKNDCGEVCG